MPSWRRSGHKNAERKATEAAQCATQAETGRRALKRAVTLAMDIECDTAEARRKQACDYGEFTFELHERLDDYDEYSDLDRLPIGAVVENICRVMGLEFDPALWQDEPWAVTEMAEKPDGSPYAEWPPEAPETANDYEPEEDEPPPEGEVDGARRRVGGVAAFSQASGEVADFSPPASPSCYPAPRASTGAALPTPYPTS